MHNTRGVFPLLLFCLAVLKDHAASQCPSTEKSAEKRLRDKLFCNYDKTVRPVKFVANQTVVGFQMYPSKIYMDEHAEAITVHGNILYAWNDMFLNWDPREYEGIDFLRVSSDEIWVPDITVDSPSESMQFAMRMPTIDCHLLHRGDVYCFPMTTLHAFCSPDLTNFPFDQQNCTLTFSSYGYQGKFVNLTFYEFGDGVRMVIYRPNKVWEVISVATMREVKLLNLEDNSTFYPTIRCNFVLQRHSAGHQAMLVAPAIVLALLVLSTFWMSSMYSGRISICCVVIVSTSLFLQYFGYMLPSNGDKAPYVITFYRDTFVIAAFAILIAISVENLHSKLDTPYVWLSGFVAKLEGSSSAQFLLLNEGGSLKDEDTAAIIESPARKKLTAWDQFANIIDRVSFVFCFFAYVVLVFFYLP